MFKTMKMTPALVAGACLTIMAIAAQAQIPKAITIPPGDLNAALESLVAQTGIQLLYDLKQVEDFHTQGVHGAPSAQEAVTALLKGTPLTTTTDSSGAILIAVPDSSLSTDASVKPAGDRSWWLAQAQETGSRAEEVDEVVVTGAPYRFLDADTSGTTNLPLPIEKVPQSITLLSADFMRAAGINQTSDFDHYIAGVSSAGDQGGFHTTERLRGFDTSESYSRYVDGLPAAGFNHPEFSFFDRVEVVKGPSSVTYGIAPPGGLYNFVSRRAPKLYSARVAGEVGSWNSYRAEAEMGGPLNGDGSLRAVGMALYDAGDNFIHHYDHEDYGAYIGLEYSGRGRLSGAVNARFSKRSNTVTDGFLFYQDGRRPDVPRGFFQGDPERNRLDADYGLVTGHLDFAATDSLELSLKANYQDNSLERYYAFGFGLTGDGTYDLAGGDIPMDWESYAASLNALYRFRLRDVEGSFLSVSATYMHQAQDFRFSALDPHGSANTSANLSEGEAGLYSKLARWTVAATPAFLFHNDLNVKLLSAQSVVKLTDRMSILAGGSLSDPMQRQGIGSPVALIDYDYDRQTSLRGGLMYELRQKSNIYVSYSDSFEPQTLWDINHNLLPPLESSQWEMGIKSRQFNEMLLLTAAAFRIEQRNSATFAGMDAIGNYYYRPQGEVRHQGVELEAMGLVTPSLTIAAAATCLDAKLTVDSNEALVGERRLFRPGRTGSIFLVKGFDGGALRGFNVGGGIRYIGSRKTSYDGSSRDLDAYTVVDLIAGYKSSRWSAQLSLNNLFDKFYVQGNNYDTLIWGNMLGEPLNVRLRITRDLGRGGSVSSDRF